MSRIDKVNHQIQRVLSQIIREQVDNPRIGMVSVLRTETTPDLRYCKVYISVFPESAYEEAHQALAKMKGFIKKLLGKELRLKFLPDIEFVSDTSIKYSIDIQERIEEIKHELEENGSDDT